MAIAKGDCESAIVGGTSLILAPDVFTRLSYQGVLSPDGSCKTFSAGKTNPLTTPSASAQEALIRKAYEHAGIQDVGKTGLFECKSHDSSLILARRTLLTLLQVTALELSLVIR